MKKANSIRFLNKTYPFKDPNSVDRITNQDVKPFLSFIKGIQLFNESVYLSQINGLDYVNFGGEASKEDLFLALKKELVRILKLKDVEASESMSIDQLLGLVNSELIGPNGLNDNEVESFDYIIAEQEYPEVESFDYIIAERVAE